MDIKEYYSEVTDFKNINSKINEFNFACKNSELIKQVVEDTNKLIDLDYIKESNAIENEKTSFKIVSWGMLVNIKHNSIVPMLLSQANKKNFKLSPDVIIKVTSSPHVLALETVLNKAKADKLENNSLTDYVVSDAHLDLLKNGPQEMWAGRYRDCPVRVSGVKDWLPPNCVKVPHLMEELVRKYNEDWKNDHPIIKAAKFHCEMIHIHPFFDGNGRTARLMTNYILVRNNFPIITIKKNNKQQYFDAVNEGIVSGNLTGMVNIILKGLEQRYKQYVFKINESKNIENGLILKNKNVVVKLGKSIFYSENIDNDLSDIDDMQQEITQISSIGEYENFKKSFLAKQLLTKKGVQFTSGTLHKFNNQDNNTNGKVENKVNDENMLLTDNNSKKLNSENLNQKPLTPKK